MQIFRSCWSCRILIFAFALSTVACHGTNPDELSFTREKPAQDDVVGTWVPVSEDSKTTQENTVLTQALEIRKDGSFSALKLPTPPDVAGASSNEFLSGSGFWDFATSDDGFTVWVINLDFANHHREKVHLKQQKPPYFIYIFLGDPDSGRSLVLSRVSLTR